MSNLASPNEYFRQRNLNVFFLLFYVYQSRRKLFVLENYDYAKIDIVRVFSPAAA